ncbi:hypothetical protein [Nonomuraea mesophila]|uniref:hypothetical protein n=1 Tax=Nonomuraea mesophila TaxID=2530382 RepID=UPI00140D92BF|nr:hypothetical protein [Nonomuraea mesophila]
MPGGWFPGFEGWLPVPGGWFPGFGGWFPVRPGGWFCGGLPDCPGGRPPGRAGGC